MKAIKVSEVRAIKREFHLTEQEGWYLEDIADEVNPGSHAVRAELPGDSGIRM